MWQLKKNQAGFGHVFGILFVVVVIAIVGGIGLLVLKKWKESSGSTGQVWTTDCVGTDRVNLTHMPMDLKDVATITPYGLIAGAHVTPIDHLYFYPKEGPRDSYPVYAMADGYIQNISIRSVQTDNGSPKKAEYRIEMQHSCQTLTYFDLITKLDQTILDQVKDADKKGINGHLPIKAGQIIGWIGEQSLDTAVYNAYLALPGFISPELYEAEPWKIHTDDFFSYFPQDMQAQMAAKNRRKVAPLSGKIDYDQPGKLIGNWFKEGTKGYGGPKGEGPGEGDGRGYWSGHLAIFYDAIDPSKVIVSIGEFKNGQPQGFSVIGNSPDPATITKDSGIVKYELTQLPAGIMPDGSAVPQQGPVRILGVVLFQVLEGERLKVEAFPDKTAAQVTTFSSPSMYER
ncbi:MAG TPA: hypothetical protein VFB59_03630 [Candidatus Saccharimonadales bacterium]|nr:hypothetical protein [Candidatus Saccharimonadales bacterium]